MDATSGAEKNVSELGYVSSILRLGFFFYMFKYTSRKHVFDIYILIVTIITQWDNNCINITYIGHLIIANLPRFWPSFKLVRIFAHISSCALEFKYVSSCHCNKMYLEHFVPHFKHLSILQLYKNNLLSHILPPLSL